MVTPQKKAKKLAQSIGLKEDLYLKREDLHPFGSHKGRSIPVMIKKYADLGHSSFIISSSGNAALAAAMTVVKYNIENDDKISLQIFVGEKIHFKKMQGIKDAAKKDGRILVRKVSNPKQGAFLEEKNNDAKLLRQSTDDFALAGYEELALELSKIKNIGAVFIPTSSGTTAQGLHLGFKKIGINPQIHIAQTSECHPIIDSWVPSSGEPSLARAIVDKVGHRKNSVINAMKSSGGNGWIISNSEITEAINLVKQAEDIDISPNSSLSVAGLKKAVQSGIKFKGPVVCLITGL